MTELQQDGRKQQGEGDGQGHDERASKIAEKHEQNRHHQQDSLGQIVQDGVGRVMYQVAAVEMGDNLHPGWKLALVQVLHLFMQRLKCGVELGALAQQHNALYDVVVVDHAPVFAMGRFTDLAEPDLRTLRHHRDIADSNRHPALASQHGGADVVGVGHQSDGPNVKSLLAVLDEAAAGVHVVRGQGLLDLADAQAVGDQPVWIDPDLVLAGDAAEAHHIHDVANRFELLFEYPILQRLQLHQVIFGIGAG